MHRHLVLLAAFFMEADVVPLSPRKIVLDPHADDGADTGEGVGHHPDERAVAQPDHS